MRLQTYNIKKPTLIGGFLFTKVIERMKYHVMVHHESDDVFIVDDKQYKEWLMGNLMVDKLNVVSNPKVANKIGLMWANKWNYNLGKYKVTEL